MKRIMPLLLLAAILLCGCVGPAPIRPAEGPDKAMAYGNITIPGKVLTGVALYKYGEVYAPPFKSPPRSHTYTNGNFFFENLAPGKYYLVSFMSGNNIYYFDYSGVEKENIERSLIEIKAGAAVYLGSFRVTGETDHLLRQDTFDIEQVGEPTEKTILTHLKEATAQTGWDRKIAQRLKRL